MNTYTADRDTDIGHGMGLCASGMNTAVNSDNKNVRRRYGKSRYNGGGNMAASGGTWFGGGGSDGGGGGCDGGGGGGCDGGGAGGGC